MARFEKEHPVWRIMEHQQRTLIWLARRTGYSHSHVKCVKSGQWPASAEFRRKCSWALDLPEDMLFLPAPTEEHAEPVQVA